MANESQDLPNNYQPPPASAEENQSDPSKANDTFGEDESLKRIKLDPDETYLRYKLHDERLHTAKLNLQNAVARTHVAIVGTSLAFLVYAPSAMRSVVKASADLLLLAACTSTIGVITSIVVKYLQQSHQRRLREDYRLKAEARQKGILAKLLQKRDERTTSQQQLIILETETEHFVYNPATDQNEPSPPYVWERTVTLMGIGALIVSFALLLLGAHSAIFERDITSLGAATAFVLMGLVFGAATYVIRKCVHKAVAQEIRAYEAKRNRLASEMDAERKKRQEANQKRNQLKRHDIEQLEAFIRENGLWDAWEQKAGRPPSRKRPARPSQ